MKTTINLDEYRAKPSDGTVVTVFTGRDRGEQVRRNSKINSKESTFDEIEIIIPKDIYSINPSFFEELFFNVVRKLGKEKFLKKFKFTPEGNYKYEKPLNEAINRILRENSALG